MEMPEDWNDHKGWDAYYKAHLPDVEQMAEYEIRDSLRFFPASENTKVWIAGCGVTLSPWLFSNLNCEVLATDASSVAIEFQHRLLQTSPFERLASLDAILGELEITAPRQFIKPKIRVEDFRHSSPQEQFDVIVNEKALQGLPGGDIEKAAKIFFASNKEGGVFIASTMNLPNANRTQMENAFLEAGYLIPNVKAEQWYRKKLDETGILYVMVLGVPMIPQWGQYENNEGKAQEDRERLRSFKEAYMERLYLNAEEDKKNYRPEKDKVAYLLYNTG